MSKSYLSINGRLITMGGLGMTKTSITQNGWLGISVPTTTAYDMSFIDENNGYIADNSANIYYTSNASGSWTVKTKPTGTSSCTKLYFTDNNIGFWIIQNQNNLYRTTDGANNWTSVISYYANDIFFINKSTGWVTLAGLDTAAKSTNSGASWGYTVVDTGSTKNAIHFSDLNNGAICGFKGNNGNIWKTINGGSIWSSTFVLTGTSFAFKDIYCINSNIIYAVGYSAAQGSVFAYTTNGGTNWNTSSIPGITNVVAMWFTDANTGWVCDASNVAKTTDAGANWTVQVADAGAKNYTGLQMINSQIGYISNSSAPTLYKTTSGGNSINV